MTKFFRYLLVTVLALIASVGIFAGNDAGEEVTGITIRSFNYPVLKEKVNNPVLRIAIRVEKESVINRLLVKNFEKGGRVLKNCRVFSTGTDSVFSANELYGKPEKVKHQNKIDGSQILQKGVNYFWISYELRENCSSLGQVAAVVQSIRINGVDHKPEIKRPQWMKVGLALRQHGQDGVHTYRIPGLVTTNAGTLLAIYDVRRDSGRDLQGDIDIGVSRSTDGGCSWEPMLIAMDQGKWNGLPEKFNGVSDACILVDRFNGDIYLVGLWMHGVISPQGKWIEGLNESSTDWNHQWRDKGSQPGFDIYETSQFLIAKSIDDGQTWSEPVNLTSMCKDPEWWLWAPAPGHGIAMEDGTLVFPTQGRDAEGLPFSNITYSKDGGQTWQTSQQAFSNTTECMVVQLKGGSLMLNMRNNRNHTEKGERNGRAVAVTDDLGQTWRVHETSQNALIEPVCMASIHRHYYTNKDGRELSVLLFSNPNSKYKRHRQTIKVSFDDGMTWPEKYWLELDEGVGAGYSCLTSIDEQTIGIVYEGSQSQLIFQQVSLSELIGKD